MRGQRAVVGIDLGTSGVKVLVAGLGDAVLGDAVLGRGRAEYPVLVPGLGRAESDPGDWWRATCRAVRQALAQAREAEIVGVAVAGKMHGLVLAGDGAGAGEGAGVGNPVFAGDAGGERAVAGAAVGRG